MKVYRIALPTTHELNTKGRYQGPYQGHYFGETHELSRQMNWAHMNSTHPSPWEDITEDGVSLNISDNEFCVFSSEEQMAEWFEGFGEKLGKAGFVVAVYEVEASTVREARYQSVCPLSDSWIVEVLPPAGMIE